MLIVLMFIDERKFQEKVTEYDKILLGDWLVLGK